MPNYWTAVRLSTAPLGRFSNAGRRVLTLISEPVTDPAAAGQAVFDATTGFHNPAHVPEWSDLALDAAFEGVRMLVMSSLGVRGGISGQSSNHT
jgi:hypothetical protein